MTINIEKMRVEMATEQRKLDRDTRRFVVTTVISAILAAAALVGAGVAVGNYIARQPLPAPAPIVIQVPAAAPAK
jgi:hypothetical protein